MLWLLDRHIVLERFVLEEFLTRNGHPYAYIDLDRDDGVQELLDQFKVSAAGCPDLDLSRQSCAS